MSFTPFDLEYTQSKWEQIVDFNLTESGVHPLRLDELLGDDQAKVAGLMATEINYPHVNGSPEGPADRPALPDDRCAREFTMLGSSFAVAPRYHVPPPAMVLSVDQCLSVRPGLRTEPSSASRAGPGPAVKCDTITKLLISSS